MGKPEWDDEAEKTLRKLSCDLSSKIEAIPLYDRLSSRSRGFLPSSQKSFEAATLLMGLSNSVHDQDRSKNIGIEHKINTLLNLETDNAKSPCPQNP